MMKSRRKPQSLSCFILQCGASESFLTMWRSRPCTIHHSQLHGSCGCLEPFQLFNFPRCQGIRQQWAVLANRKDGGIGLLRPLRHHRVCSKHFLEKQPTTDNPLPVLNLAYNEANFHPSMYEQVYDISKIKASQPVTQLVESQADDTEGKENGKMETANTNQPVLVARQAKTKNERTGASANDSSVLGITGHELIAPTAVNQASMYMTGHLDTAKSASGFGPQADRVQTIEKSSMTGCERAEGSSAYDPFSALEIQPPEQVKVKVEPIDQSYDVCHRVNMESFDQSYDVCHRMNMESFHQSYDVGHRLNMESLDQSYEVCHQDVKMEPIDQDDDVASHQNYTEAESNTAESNTGSSFTTLDNVEKSALVPGTPVSLESRSLELHSLESRESNGQCQTRRTERLILTKGQKRKAATKPIECYDRSGCCVINCPTTIRGHLGQPCPSHLVVDCACARLYPFPSDQVEKFRWMRLVNRRRRPDSSTELYQPTEASRVCGYHFPEGRPTFFYPSPTLHLGYERLSQAVRERIVDPGLIVPDLTVRRGGALPHIDRSLLVSRGTQTSRDTSVGTLVLSNAEETQTMTNVPNDMVIGKQEEASDLSDSDLSDYDGLSDCEETLSSTALGERRERSEMCSERHVNGVEVRGVKDFMRETIKERETIKNSSSRSFDNEKIDAESEPPGPLQCPSCIKTFNSFDSFESHCAQNECNRENKCPFCEMKYTHKTSLRIHTLVKHEFCRSDCLSCGKSFKHFPARKKHIREVHGNNYSCLVCSKVLPRQFVKFHLLQYHLKDEAIVYKCDICGRKCSNSNTLSKHKRLRHGTSQKCPYCGKVYAGLSNGFKVHLRTHTGETPYHCEYCDKAFRDGNNLRLHRMIHTGEKPHRCGLCGKAFVQKNNLTQHLKTHNTI